MSAVLSWPVDTFRIMMCWDLVDSSGGLDACWPWTGSVNPKGYGVLRMPGNTSRSAHRVAFEDGRGPLERRLQVDHTCHDPQHCLGGPSCSHRRCCNPRHLAATTPRQNTLRGNTPAARNAASERCPEGHRYDSDTGGQRRCSQCSRIYRRRYKAGYATRNRSGKTRLTDDEVRVIRASPEPAPALALRYGYTPEGIRSIQLGRTRGRV